MIESKQEFNDLVNRLKDLNRQHKLSQHLQSKLEAFEEVNELINLSINGVVSSCVDKDTLIEDLDDKRIVGVTLDENMWHYCRKETAEHLLDKYEIRPK